MTVHFDGCVNHFHSQFLHNAMQKLGVYFGGTTWHYSMQKISTEIIHHVTTWNLYVAKYNACGHILIAHKIEHYKLPLYLYMMMVAV